MNPMTQLQAALAAVYRIEREIGRGGMAAVYLAHDLRHERPVAIKVLEPRIALLLGRDRFLREIRLAAGLQHPHIVPVHDSGAFDRPPPDAPGLYYVMPFVEGESLRERLSREGPLPVEEAVRLAGEVADALACAHAHGVLHRDIKPENILLSQGHALVTDFGIAKAVPAPGEGADALGSMTETGLVLGTAAYMSPEQATGARDLDARTDLYSLGCVLYEMLGGQPPFKGATPQATLVSRLTTDPPGVRSLRPEVPVALETALTRALAREPDARFASAAELAGALASAARDHGGPSPRSGETRIVSTGTARARHRAAGLAAIVLLIGLIAVFALGRRRGPTSPAEPIPVAVLPFRTLGGTGPALPLAVGIPDAIISRLAGVGQLRLRPTSAILRYADRDVDPGVAGRELAVDYLLTGTVQDAGDRLRVSVQLVRSRDGAPLWGTHYDLPRQDLLTLQDSIAARVSGALAVRMTSAEQERLYRRYTRNGAAYEAFLRGRAELARLTEPGARAAVAAFEQALALDSDYALAHAGLAMASADMHLRFAKDAEVAEWGARARREATRALALDSTVAEAHLAQAAVYRKSEFDWDATIRESRRALALNPSLDLPHYFIAAAYYHLGLLDRADAEVRPPGRPKQSQRAAEDPRGAGFSPGWVPRGDRLVRAAAPGERQPDIRFLPDPGLLVFRRYGSRPSRGRQHDPVTGGAGHRSRPRESRELSGGCWRREGRSVARHARVESVHGPPRRVWYGQRLRAAWSLRQGPRVAPPERRDRVRLLSLVRARPVARAAPAGSGLPGAVRRAQAEVRGRARAVRG